MNYMRTAIYRPRLGIAAIFALVNYHAAVEP
jgi:hypothetical protein